MLVPPNPSSYCRCSLRRRDGALRHVLSDPTMMPGRAPSPIYRVVLFLLAGALVAFCAYLALGLGVVPQQDLWVFLLATCYGICFAAFLREAPAASAPPIRSLVSRGRMRVEMLTLLVTSFLLSIVTPAIWILFVPGITAQQVALLAPHLFCLCGQVIFEVICFRPGVNQLLRLAIPVLSTAYRFSRLLEWVRRAEAVVRLGGEGVAQSDQTMLGLAVVNLVFWTGVLFYFLLLRVVPIYFTAPKADADASKSAYVDEVQGIDANSPLASGPSMAGPPSAKKQL